MTTRMLLTVVFRRWYLLLLGLILTATLAALVLASSPAVYWSMTRITLLQPNPNPVRVDTDALASTASVLVLRANGRVSETKTSLPTTTLVGEGILEGSRIRLYDVGGQWSTSVPDPIIVIEVAGSDPAEVFAQSESIIAALQTDLTELQDQLGINDNRIFTRASPEEPQVVAFGAASRSRALGATTAIGLMLTGLALYASGRLRPAASSEEFQDP